jgi:N-acetylglucosamine-6-sulfatase
MRMPPAPLPDTIMPELDNAFRSRWETLLAVDEMVADVVGALEETNKLDNTYLIYTSDNGYHIGKWIFVVVVTSLYMHTYIPLTLDP